MLESRTAERIRGQWESGLHYSTCMSLSARAALSYSAAKERKEKRGWKRDEEKMKDSGKPLGINHHKTQEEIQRKERKLITVEESKAEKFEKNRQW